MFRLAMTFVTLLALVSVACGGKKVVEGVVDHKTVTGVVASTGYTILQNLPAHDRDAVNDRPSIRVKDQEFQRFFTSENEHAVVTAGMETELGRKYSDIRYTVNIRLPDGDGRTEPYFVSREIFNRILVDSPVRVEASGSPIPTISKLLEPGE